ncbi:Potassium efflux system KefA precursor [Anaerobiospirillum thomasii]|uniref:mechanosensitive ion channel domain-containing protein n=1 Tax=Anaerobiospirillum thomasii TaxID=179995 RepID=UPI000D807DDA|nr:mechanosensitive ion channel domain-containing protein [Anaerobiospirillum thomasii]SPT72106.1 Potassium efflux system KefA precursor [Anaerobiospirillum thomasii]
MLNSLRFLCFAIFATVLCAQANATENITSSTQQLDVIANDEVTDPLSHTSLNVTALEHERKKIEQYIEEINSQGALSDEAKQSQINTLRQTDSYYDKLITLHENEKSFSDSIENLPNQIKKYEKLLGKANEQYSKEPPSVSDLTEKEITEELNKLTGRQKQVQENLNQANSEYVNYQSLPNKAQDIITQNTNELNALNMKLTETKPLSKYEIQLVRTKIVYFEAENLFLQKQLNYRTQLQDVSNYRIKILSLENKYLTDYIRSLQTRQNEIISDNLINESPTANEELLSIPALKAQFDRNKALINYIDNRLKDNVRMRQEFLDVENALASVKQIEKNLNEQLNQLDGSLILSRLLNRQQSEIPSVQISFNLDELIPNLNIWMYDLRNFRDNIFDINSYVDNVIKENPTLKDHKTEIESIVRQRRVLYDQLYQGLSEAQTLAIKLKLNYNEYIDIKNKVSALINDHLFWLASNLPLGRDFIVSLPTTIKLQLLSIKTTLFSDGFISNADNILLPVVIPLLLLGGFISFIRRYIVRIDNKLAMRLDKATDGYLVTPIALFNKFILIIPKAVLIIIIGSLIIYTALENPTSHYRVMGMLALHVVVFLFFLEILRTNSLSQRHFSTPPDKVVMQRAFIDKVWFAVIPVLTIANIREIEPIKISADIFGFLIVYSSCLYLTYIILKTLKTKFENEDLQFKDWVQSIFAITVPLSLIIMLSLGYYYTAIKLINRFAYTFYICMLYVLVSNLIRRELYVAEIKLLRTSKIKQLLEKNKTEEESRRNSKNIKGRLPDLSTLRHKTNKIEQLRFELINTKAFKLINIFLLVGTACLLYLQWSDLAGVLSFLDTISLWTSKSVVDGKEIVTISLTLADLTAAIIILIVSVILNRNLPPLLERLFMLKFSIGHKSTSYTVKIITSYLITALGIIFAASALGISWDNLQWLVAALSVGLGFGLQEIFANFVSGLIILFERQIRVGDIITLNGLSGTVNRIRIRATTIISFDNKEVVIPNREFITSALTNWSLTNTVTMLEFMVGVAYDADVVRAKQILTQIVKSCRTLATDKPPRIYVKSLDASCVSIMCEVFVNQIADRKGTYDYLSTQTLLRFAKENIEIPFNQLDVKIKNLDNGETLKIN